VEEKTLKQYFYIKVPSASDSKLEVEKKKTDSKEMIFIVFLPRRGWQSFVKKFVSVNSAACSH
jgi:hypothetical protein